MSGGEWGKAVRCDGCGCSGVQWRGDTPYICMVCGGWWASVDRRALERERGQL